MFPLFPSVILFLFYYCLTAWLYLQVMEETKKMVHGFEVTNLKQALDLEMKAFSKFLLTDKCHKKLCQDWTAAINLYGTA